MLHQSQRKKEVDCLDVLMTFKLCQTLQGLEPAILRSLLLPNYGLKPSILACERAITLRFPPLPLPNKTGINQGFWETAHLPLL